MGLQLRFEVGGFGPRNPGSDAQRRSNSPVYADCIFRSFFRSQAPQERQIVSLLVGRTRQDRRQDRLDRPNPLCVRKLSTLVIGYGNEPRFRKLANDVGQSRKFEPTVRGGEKPHSQPAEQREREPVDTQVDHVEFTGASCDRLQKKGAGGTGVCALEVEAQRAKPYREQLFGRPAILTSE